MAGFALTGDIFNMFVWFELMGVVGLRARRLQGRASSGRCRAPSTSRSRTRSARYLILIGIALLYARTGALNLAQIGRDARRPPAPTGSSIVALRADPRPASWSRRRSCRSTSGSPTPTPSRRRRSASLFSGAMVELGIFCDRARLLDGLRRARSHAPRTRTSATCSSARDRRRRVFGARHVLPAAAPEAHARVLDDLARRRRCSSASRCSTAKSLAGRRRARARARPAQGRALPGRRDRACSSCDGIDELRLRGAGRGRRRSPACSGCARGARARSGLPYVGRLPRPRPARRGRDDRRRRAGSRRSLMVASARLARRDPARRRARLPRLGAAGGPCCSPRSRRSRPSSATPRSR